MKPAWLPSIIELGCDLMGKEQMRILVADDDRDLVFILALSLRKKGFEVYEAHSGFEALESAKEFNPDVILSDIKMPNGSGLDLLRALRKENELPPPFVALMTGYSDVSEEDLMKEGAVKVFQKPVSIPALIGFIEKLSQPSSKESG